MRVDLRRRVLHPLGLFLGPALVDRRFDECGLPEDAIPAFVTHWLLLEDVTLVPEKEWSLFGSDTGSGSRFGRWTFCLS
jgi:hypothetical protein